jgi:glycosyltransferase involved in cell wall biosynthesis
MGPPKHSGIRELRLFMSAIVLHRKQKAPYLLTTPEQERQFTSDAWPSGDPDVSGAHSGVHIVQLSTDDSVFVGSAGDEPRRRQISYAQILRRHHPGSRITMLVFTRNGTNKPLSMDGITFVPLHYRGGLVRFSAKLGALYRALIDVNRCRRIDVLTFQAPDEAAWLVRLFARSRAIPVVAQLHYDFFSKAARSDVFGRGPTGLLRAGLAGLLLKRCAALRVVGLRTAEHARNWGVRSPIEVLPVAVQMVAGSHTGKPRTRERRVLFVGRLVPQKNLEQWLAVATRVAEQDASVRFDIVGDGPCRPAIERRVLELGLAQVVTFHGFLPYNELTVVYSRASLLLLTSSYEGFGRVIVEALSCETPVVAVRLSGVEDIVVDGKTGILLGATDVKGLANAVLSLLHNPDLSMRMGREGALDVRRRFDPHLLASRWVSLLSGCVRRSATEVIALMPRARTWARWNRFRRSRNSLLRTLQYEAIEGLVLKGHTLDVGGGRVNSYYSLLRIDGSIESINIDPRVQPTYQLDLNQALPLPDNSYDNILSLNTFEHVSNDTQALAEAMRVLKPGGEFHISVPFLYRVHGSPNDYHRHTAQWWHDEIMKHGNANTRIVIEPLVWDRMMSAFSLWDVSRAVRAAGLLISVVRDLRWRREARLPALGRNQVAVDYPVGYYIRGRK